MIRNIFYGRIFNFVLIYLSSPDNSFSGFPAITNGINRNWPSAIGAPAPTGVFEPVTGALPLLGCGCACNSVVEANTRAVRISIFTRDFIWVGDWAECKYNTFKAYQWVICLHWFFCCFYKTKFPGVQRWAADFVNQYKGLFPHHLIIIPYWHESCQGHQFSYCRHWNPNILLIIYIYSTIVISSTNLLAPAILSIMKRQ